MTEQSAREKAARQYNDDKQQIAEKMALGMTPSPGKQKASGEDERLMFWQADPSQDEQEHWRDVMAAAEMNQVEPRIATMMAWPDIMRAVYPKRDEVMNAGVRKKDVSARVAFVDRMLKLGPPGEGDD